ncbi:MAG: tetratricopeptide (TPR) repeat protein [Bradymonadia bacterium]
MKSTEFLEHERELARRFGLRKTDVFFQIVRCTACSHEAMVRNRYRGHVFTCIDEIEREMLRQVGRTIRAACGKCKAKPLSGDGSRHVFLCYSERGEAHLAVTLRLDRSEGDDRVKVNRQVWWAPLDAKAVEISDAADPRLDALWRDSELRRWALDPEPSKAIEGITKLTETYPSDAAVWRELAQCYIEAGQAQEALTAYERCLKERPNQPKVLQRAGRLAVAFGRADHGSELLARAYDITEDPALLPEVIRAAYRGHRWGALSAAAEALLEIEPEALVAYKARAATATVGDVGEWLDAWQDLRDSAKLAGERWTEAIAAAWCDTLSLPIPDWAPSVGHADYIEQLADECDSAGLDVDRDPGALRLGDAEFRVDLLVTSDEGMSYAFILQSCMHTAASEHTWLATCRAAVHDERLSGCRVVPITRHPLPYSVARWTAAVVDAAVDVRADADTTMAVLEENITAFVQTVEASFGRSLDFSLESLDDVDTILSRYHDEGFGACTYALACQAAAYVGAVLRAPLGEAEWTEGDDGMDPFVLALESGGQINLIGKIRRAVENGKEDGVAHFADVLINELALKPAGS